MKNVVDSKMHARMWHGSLTIMFLKTFFYVLCKQKQFIWSPLPSARLCVDYILIINEKIVVQHYKNDHNIIL